MRQYRRHAVVAILVVAAVITPTTDAMTLLVVALPVCLLYEMSIFIVRLTRTAQPIRPNHAADKAERGGHSAQTELPFGQNGKADDNQ